jgi:hypothetical protein
VRTRGEEWLWLLRAAMRSRARKAVCAASGRSVQMMVTSVERDAVEVVRSATSKSRGGPRAGQCGWSTRTETQSASGEQRESRREAAVAPVKNRLARTLAARIGGER